MILSEALALTHDSRWGGTKDEEKTYQRASKVVELLGDPNVATIYADTGDRLAALLRAEGKAPSTINRYTATLRAMMRTAVKHRAIDHAPKFDTQREPEGRSRWLTTTEESELFNHLPPHLEKLSIFLVDTGCREGEALNLRWENVKPDAVELRNTKTARPRRVPMTMRVREIIEELRPNEVGPFTAISGSQLQAGFRQAREATQWAKGDAEIVPHILRHTCASRLVAKGVDIYVVKSWLGHSSIKTTERYAHLRPEALDAAVKVLESS